MNDYRRFLEFFLAPVMAVSLIMLSLAVYFEPVNGDLTRIGKWPERDYGWRRPQPAMPVLANDVSASDAQVLILGDSFSRKNIWQSVISKNTGLATLTFDWDDVDCPDSWLDLIASGAYPSARIVIIEVAERNLINRFTKWVSCPAKKTPVPHKTPAGVDAPQRQYWPLTMDYGYLVGTARHAFSLLTHRGSALRKGETMNVPLIRKDLFSNRHSDRLLYLLYDDLKKYWSETQIQATVEYFLRIRSVLVSRGMVFLPVIIPDKSSVYEALILERSAINKTAPIIDRLNSLGIPTVDLFGLFKRSMPHEIDFYLPNDTHCSNRGYLLLGQEIAGMIGSLDAVKRPTPTPLHKAL